jgi:hypothetical protein
MAIRRYARTPVLKLGEKYGTSNIILTIRSNIDAGNIRTQIYISTESERLDIIAGEQYNDSSLWWIIAAASNIGWGLQVPAGTLLTVPLLSDIQNYIG